MELTGVFKGVFLMFEVFVNLHKTFMEKTNKTKKQKKVLYNKEIVLDNLNSKEP